MNLKEKLKFNNSPTHLLKYRDANVVTPRVKLFCGKKRLNFQKYIKYISNYFQIVYDNYLLIRSCA